MYQFNRNILQSLVFSMLLLALITAICQKAMGQRFPATVIPVVERPYTTYLNDYFSSSTKFNATIIFNDYNEPSWDVKLRVSIESSKLGIQTRNEYIPPSPIKVFPGIPLQITGADLSPYFRYENLIVNGISSSVISTNGRLPEGFYSFCLEVLDYRSGKPLSQKSCSNIWINLMDEPITQLPSCGSVIDPVQPQNIIFQWQQSNASSSLSMGTEYQLTLYELLDRSINPLNAIQAAKTLKIFESGFINQTTFLYGASAPVLDPGKRYIYTVQARDIGGRDVFKNNGISQVCWFDFGYPLNGFVNLKEPINQTAFRLGDPMYFKWDNPDNQLSSQQVSYNLKIVEIGFNQTPEQAILNNPAWFETATHPTSRKNGYDFLVSKKLSPLTDYAWQVTAFTGSQQIAASKVFTFRGPGIIEKFRAGNHEVTVHSTFNRDMTNLSGTGSIIISGDGKTQEVNFKNLNLKPMGSGWVLQSGEILENLTDTSAIELTPELPENGKGYFYPKKLKLNKDALELYGDFKWPLPHPITIGERAFVTCEKSWVNYDDYTLDGRANLNGSNLFPLLSPFDFDLNLTAGSYFLINNSAYIGYLNGEVVLPEKVKGTTGKKIAFPFKEAKQLFYITTSVALTNNFRPVNNVTLVLHPTLVTIDLSETASPGKFKDDPSWKGIYLDNFKINYSKELDLLGQVKFAGDVIRDINLNNLQDGKAWVTPEGLTFSIKEKFTQTDKGYFNTFPSSSSLLNINIENNTVKDSYLKGNLLIPVISNNKTFPFTSTLTGYGFQPGYLDSLDGSSFTFSEGGGQNELKVIVQKGVFSDRERIDMSLDLEWPALKVQLKSLTGFRAWGNYSIGFYKPNGSRMLTEPLLADLSGNPATVTKLGAGSSDGAYSFGVTADIDIGEDVSGDKGSPTANIYSISPSSLLPKSGKTYNTVSNNLQNGNNIEGTSASAESLAEADIDIIKNDFIKKLNENTTKVTLYPGSLPSIKPDTLFKKFKAEEIAGATEAIEDNPKTKTWATVKFDVKEEKLILSLRMKFVAQLASPLTNKLNETTGKINKKINDKVSSVTDSVNNGIKVKLDRMLDSLAIKMAKVAKRDNFDPSQEIHKVADGLSDELYQEIRTSINSSVSQNITSPITTVITGDISGRTTAFLNNQIEAGVTDLMDGKKGSYDVKDDLLKGASELIGNIGEDVYKKVNFNKLRSSVIRTGADVFASINIGDVFQRLSIALAKDAGSVVSGSLQKVAKDKIRSLARNSEAGQENETTVTASAGVSLNFDNLGKNLKEGRIDKIFRLDPVNIAVNNKFVGLAGSIYYSPDHPVYGNIWKGDIAFSVKMPKKFSIGGTYVNGRKEGTSYWFCQISGAKDPKDIGGILPNRAEKLENPVLVGPVQLVGAAGRIFHHMSDAPGQPIRPDPNTNYGAYMNFVFFDESTKGKTLRLDLGAGIQIRDDGNYVVDFDGNMQVGNQNPQVLFLDPYAMASGGLKLRYNSAESHFLGNGWLVVKKPGSLCAQGSVLVETKPGYWRLGIGSREQRIIFQPGCAGWAPTGWLDVDPKIAELGLGLQLSIYAKAGFKSKTVSAEIGLDAGIAAGIMAKVQYNPSFVLHEAGIWAEVWGRVFVNYDVAVIGRGSVDLVSVYASGNMKVIFIPKPVTARGEFNGHIEVLGIFGCDFSAGFEKQIGSGSGG